MVLCLVFINYDPPATLGIFQKAVDADITHQLLSNHGHKVGKCPAAFYHALYMRDLKLASMAAHNFRKCLVLGVVHVSLVKGDDRTYG